MGHGALFTQQGVGATGYDAIDRRRAYTADLQEGIIDSGYPVTQRAAGTNMSVDIGANLGAAYVLGDAVAGQGLYYVSQHTALINETISAAHSTLPRIDTVWLQVLDNVHDATGGNLGRTIVVTGTATSGATLNNRTGAVDVSGALLLADVLVAAGATSITNAAIRDRRRWARGARFRVVRNANAASGNDYAPNFSTLALLDGTNLAPRIECSGVPVRVRLTCNLIASSTESWVTFSPQVDSVGVDGMGSVGASVTAGGGVYNGLEAYVHLSSVAPTYVSFEWEFTPSAGSHIIAPAIARDGGSGVIVARTNSPVLWSVEEIVRQTACNNATSG